MLAGRMKLKTFALIVAALAAAAVAGLYFTCRGGDEPPALSSSGDDSNHRSAGDQTGQTAGQTGGQTAALPDTKPVGKAALRPVDQVLMSYQGKDLGADKRKDVTRGKPYKVNLYQDAGHSQVNRAKVDLDRDDKWDEKWTFDNDHITRKLAPADDENYTQSFLWDGAAWIPE